MVVRTDAAVTSHEMNWCALGWSGGCVRLVAGSGGLDGVFDGMDEHSGLGGLGQRGFCFCLCSSQRDLRLRCERLAWHGAACRVVASWSWAWLAGARRPVDYGSFFFQKIKSIH